MDIIHTFDEFTAHLRDDLLEGYPGTLAPDSTLFEEIGLDSLEIFHIVVFIEDLAGAEIELEMPPAMETVMDAYEYYRSVVRMVSPTAAA
jgi:acyl carrier protein